MVDYFMPVRVRIADDRFSAGAPSGFAFGRLLPLQFVSLERRGATFARPGAPPTGFLWQPVTASGFTSGRLGRLFGAILFADRIRSCCVWAVHLHRPHVIVGVLPRALPQVLHAYMFTAAGIGFAPLVLKYAVHQPQPAKDALFASDVGHGVAAEFRLRFAVAGQRANESAC